MLFLTNVKLINSFSQAEHLYSVIGTSQARTFYTIWPFYTQRRRPRQKSRGGQQNAVLYISACSAWISDV